MAPKNYGEILGRLADLTPEDIQAALAEIRAEAESFAGQDPTAEVVARIAELTDAARKFTGELSARAATQQAFQDNMAALADMTAPAPEPEPANTPEPEPAAQQPVTDPPAADKPDEGDAEPDDEPDDTGEDKAVTAAAKRRLGSNNQGAPNGGRRTLPRLGFRTTAAVGLQDTQVGAQMTLETLLSEFSTKIDQVQGLSMQSGARPERYTVATRRADYPEERWLSRTDSAFATMQKIEAAIAEAQKLSASDNAQALVAAGLCAPFDNLYDIEVIGDTARPVRDALVRFGVDRGGIQYRPAIEGVGQTGGIGTWTEANDQASPLVPKTCLEVACPSLTDAQVDALYRCLTFSNMSTKFDPEFMAAVIRANLVAFDRFAENKILTTITNASKKVYTVQLLGAARDTLANLDRMIAYYRNVHRLRNEVPLRLIGPLWFLNMLRADITNQMVGDGLQSLALTDAEITRWFTARNVNITWHLDGIDPADITEPTPDVVVPAQFYTTLATGSQVPNFPDGVSTLLFREGDWLFLDGGTLDMGTVRDSTLNGLNRFQTFAEGFEGVAFRGIESFELVFQVNPTGASAATVSTATAS